MLIDLFDAELERRHRPGIERAGEPLGKPPGHIKRPDKIELARLARVVALETLGKTGVEIVVVALRTTAITKLPHFFTPTLCIPVATQRSSASSVTNIARVPFVLHSPPVRAIPPTTLITFSQQTGTPLSRE